MPRPEAFDTSNLPEHTAQVIEKLSNAQMLLVPPPEKAVAFPDGRRISMEKALFIRGDSLLDFANLVNRELVTPYTLGKPVDEFSSLLRHAFGLYVAYDPVAKRTIINRIGAHAQLPFYIQGPSDESMFPNIIKGAITAAAVVPDTLWEDMRQGGLVVGSIGDNYDDVPWKVRPGYAFTSAHLDIPESGWKDQWIWTPFHAQSEPFSSSGKSMVGVFTDLHAYTPKLI